MRSRQAWLICIPLLALAVLILATNAFADVKEKVVYTFLGPTVGDGYAPQSGLVADKAGNLYGTTALGGTSNRGTVYELSPPATPGGAWTERVLWTFGGTSGEYPVGALILDSAGNLYGTFELAVFELSPPATSGGSWIETVLWTFSGGNGSSPMGKLNMDEDGNLYGTSGGTYTTCACGLVFELVKPKTSGGLWTERVLHEFGKAANDGNLPTPDLLLRGGVLYGTTTAGGTGNFGTVFQLVRKPGPWTETILHDFTGSDGDGPGGGLIADGSGNLYGTTQRGGANDWGTVYELSPPAIAGDPWQETTLYSFTGLSEGFLPMAELWRDKTGSLYGITYGSQDPNDHQRGTAYKLKAPTTPGDPWTFVILHEFWPAQYGAYPLSTLILLNGTFYGTTSYGGTADAGIVFSLVP